MIFNKIIHLIFFSLISFQSLAFTWWDSGHMVVAKIAEERLNENAKSEIDELINVIGKSCPDSPTFIEAACWLDDIWNRGVGMVATWHGHAGPYSPDGFLSNQDMARISVKYRNNDGVAAIQRSIATLSNPQAGKWEKAFMLRVLLHVVGDLHQPLHCTQVYSEQFPEGDKGGVRFPLAGPETLTRKHLHGLWDSILLLDTARQDVRPLNGNSLQFVEDLADKIIAAYPEDSLPEKDITSPENWAKESYLAGKEAYNGIEINTVPSDEYLEKSRKVACQRLALAGYRLANILNECFPEKCPKPSELTANIHTTSVVPYISQDDNKSCAPTSLAMAISYFENLHLDKEKIWKISETDENDVYQYGNDMDGLKRIADHYGYTNEFRDHMTISNLEHLLDKGALILINIRAGSNGYHAVLVTGYDSDQQMLNILDPAISTNRTLTYSNLHSLWIAHLSTPLGLFHQSGFIIYPKSPCK